MKLTLIKTKKSQSVLEYVLTALVFTAVGYTTFVAANQAAQNTLRGEKTTYHSQNTLMGKIANDGLAQETIVYPSSFNQYAGRAENYDGTISSNAIAEEGQTTSVGQPRKDLYKYQPSNWSIDADQPYQHTTWPEVDGSSPERIY